MVIKGQSMLEYTARMYSQESKQEICSGGLYKDRTENI